MSKKQREEREQQRCENTFNSITEKSEPENQNQTHNVRREGLGPRNQKR